MALIALVTALLLTMGGADLSGAVVLALSGFTSAGVGYFAAHTQGALMVVGIIESLLGDVLFALFIAAVVRRGMD